MSNPNKEILHAIQVDSKEQDFHHSVVGVHIRSGGFLANIKERAYWITEKELPQLPSHLTEIVMKKSLSTIFYLTSDSDRIEKYVKTCLKNYTFITNTRYPKQHTTWGANDIAFKGAFYDLLITSQSSAIIYTYQSGCSDAICIMSNTDKKYRLPIRKRIYE